jgi:replication factor A1
LAVEGFSGTRQPVDVKVGELTPQSRAVNVLAKVVSKSEIRDIAAGRDGAAHKVSDALVGDETGSVYLTLWDDNITKVNEGDTINVKNGYVNLFRGNIRLNIGRYGTLAVSEQPLAGEVNTENNVSNQVYEQPRRPFRGRGDYGGGGYGGGRDYGGRERRGGYRQRRY